MGIINIGHNRITSSRGGYAIMSDYGDDYGFDDYASCLIWGSDITTGFKEAFRQRLWLKQQAHNHFHNCSHNRGIIAYSDPPIVISIGYYDNRYYTYYIAIAPVLTIGLHNQYGSVLSHS